MIKIRIRCLNVNMINLIDITQQLIDQNLELGIFPVHEMNQKLLGSFREPEIYRVPVSARKASKNANFRGDR